MLPIETPFQSYMGLDGKPLTNGKIYIGQVGTDPTVPANQVPIFWDDALTIPADQPVRTNAGYIVRNGTPAKIYVADVYSQTVQNASGVTVFYAPNSSGTIGGFISQFIGSAGSSLIGYIQSGIGAVRRTIQDRLRDTVSIKDFGAKGDGVTDDTAAINACFLYATTNFKSVHIPNGEYSVSNLIFGTQNATGQSQSPLSLIGQARDGCRFKARPGTTGTVFQAWSLAGVTLQEFSIDATGTNTMALDLEWKGTVGPSTQNHISRIRVDGGFGLVAVNLNNLNDTYPDELTVNVGNPAICAISMIQSGGLSRLDNCIWNGGFLRIACQNGVLSGCWGFGIEFAGNCVNNLSIPGGYMYPNNAYGGKNMWSASFDSFQSVHTLTIGPGTQIITSLFDATDGVFNVNVLSAIVFEGVEFISLDDGAVNMWGPSCRRDSNQNVAVRFNGGSYGPQITINNVPDFDISYYGFLSKTTGLAYQNSTKNYYLTGSNTATYGANVWYELVPVGLLVEGVYIVSFEWDHNDVAGPPYIITSSAILSIPRLTQGIAGSGREIVGSVGEYQPGLQITLNFRLTADATIKTPSIEFKCSVQLNSPGVVNWNLTKIA